MIPDYASYETFTESIYKYTYIYIYMFANVDK